LIDEEEYFESKRDLWEIAKTNVEGKESCSQVVHHPHPTPHQKKK